MNDHACILIWDAHTRMGHNIVPYAYGISHTRMGRPIRVWANIRIWGRTAKTRHVYTKTEFNCIAAVYRHTQYLSIPLYQVSNANWSAFLKGILPTLQSHGWNNGTHEGRQLDSEDLYLLPLAV